MGVQSIYFEELDELLACLEAMAADPEARLMRVVNKLSPSYDSTSTAGYRSVLLNLCLGMTAARRLCIETHVCEVQLVLVDFARIKVQPLLPFNNHLTFIIL